MPQLTYQWRVMAVVLAGVFVIVLDTTIVNLGLPALQDDFDTEHGVEWVVTAYLAAVGVSQLASGWTGDRFGKRAVFIGAMAAFTGASAACALAPTLEVLVGARVAQGAAGGLVIPTGMAMVYELFEPEERGRALGIFGIAGMAAPAIGPIVGGALVSAIGWRWLFLVNVPIGAIAIPVAMRVLRESGHGEPRPLDRGGLALATAGLFALLVGLQQGGAWGWTSPVVLTLLGSSVVLLAWFSQHSLRRSGALVDLRILAQPVFAMAMVVSGLMAASQYARLVYIPLLLGATRGIDELTIGLVMLPGAIGVASMMPFGGRLADRVGSRLPYTLGCAIALVSFWPLAHLGVDTPLWQISVALFVGGLGSGLAIMAPGLVALNSVRAAQVGQASGLNQVSRQLSGALGTAALASIFVAAAPAAGVAGPPATQPAVDAYNTVFLATMAMLAVAVVLGFVLPGRTKALALQRERAAERRELQEVTGLAARA